MSALFRKNSDKLETVEKPHPMADHGTKGLKLVKFGEGKLK